MTNKKTRDEEVAHARRYMAMPLTKAAMDRARGHWVPWLIEALDEAEAEQVRMRDELAEARAERLGYRTEYLELLRRIREGQLVTATEASLRYEGIIAASSEEPL